MRNDMNFFTPYTGIKKEEKNKKASIYSLAAIVGGVIVITLTWNTINTLSVERDIDYYKNKLNDSAMSEKLKEYEDTSKKIDYLNGYDNELTIISEAVKSKEVVTSSLLNSISSTLPTDVSLNSVSLTKGVVTIQAVSKNRTAIAEIQHNLRSLDIVDTVYIGGISGDTDYTFDIKCTLKDVE